jgi:AraC family transcriptional regulator of adaptative response / DNA-3-methyladenine glycosylase II
VVSQVEAGQGMVVPDQANATEGRIDVAEADDGGLIGKHDNMVPRLHRFFETYPDRAHSLSGYVQHHSRGVGISGCVQSISAVVTTGIYCRPGCAGRPHPGNVKEYSLAAAAEADGFRACLRCRPYRAAQPVSWTGPELVCRAVQLITDGALDGHTEDQLAARLGVSSRHLRRLFAAQLGVTPDGLARSRRVHFARRLLDDTDMPIADVAFASGFGSVRQLNRACQEVFRADPSGLRARIGRT